MLSDVNFLITAGPTHEPIDPVRFISNHSSGKMGYAIAEQAINLGAKVDLVSGPVNLVAPDKANLHKVQTATEMYEKVISLVNNCDVFIGVAAVADYKIKSPAKHKLKKKSHTLSLELEQTKDIIAAVAKLPNKPFVVGFAAETNDVESYARKKLLQKQLDMIVANDVSNAEIGFGSCHNAVKILWGQEELALTKSDKANIAHKLLLLIKEHYAKKHPS